MNRFALNFGRKTLLATICAVLLVLIVPAAGAQDNDPPAEAGRISSISGTVSVQPVGSQDWGQAYPNLTVGPGDRIFTDSDGRAEIQVGQSYLRIGPNSDVSLVEDSQFNINFGVAQGSVHLHTYALWPRQLMGVSTPNGNIEFQKAGDLRVDVYPTDGATVFTNYGEFADVTAAGDYRQELDNGQSLQLSGSNPVYPQWLQPAGADNLDSWSQQRDQQLSQVASYQYVSPDVPGAADLDSNGEWQPDTEYGPVWFPRSVAADWAPYHYGHWVNHEPWGWIWVEDESWGYAPFHYGRWVSYRGRWGWIPGPRTVRPVYSPALVVFAGGVNVGGGGVSVWFPLGPGEAYRPWYRCSPNYIDRVNISNIRESRNVHVQNTYVNVVNVTNITYVNQSRGATAMRHEDFASGRDGRNASVRVDPRQMEHVRSSAATGASSDAAFDCFASGCAAGSGFFRAPKIDQPAGPADCCQAGSHASCSAGKAHSSAQADSRPDSHCLACTPRKSGRKADAARTRTAGSEPSTCKRQSRWTTATWAASSGTTSGRKASSAERRAAGPKPWPASSGKSGRTAAANASTARATGGKAKPTEQA